MCALAGVATMMYRRNAKMDTLQFSRVEPGDSQMESGLISGTDTEDFIE